MILHKYPILYISTSNSKKRFWKLWISTTDNKKYLLHREYGILGGKITIPTPIEMNDLKKIKTKGDALFRKKKEEGFVEEEKTTQMRHQVIRPMRAHKLDDFAHKIEYPVFVQRKLDGYRCLATSQKHTIELFSRNMKPFHHLPHIKKELEDISSLLQNGLYLDGELFEKDIPLYQIGSLVRKLHVSPQNIKNMQQISFYVFDAFITTNMGKNFEQRYDYLKKLFKKWGKKWKYIKLVGCEEVDNENELWEKNEEYLMEGYEGIIVRNKKGLYEFNKKSYDVLRTKEFKHDEFEIVGAKEGQGQQKGAIVWECGCKKKKEKTFWAIPEGTIEERRKMWKEYEEEKKRWIGRRVRVKYLEMDTEGCVTRNPIVEEFI